MKKIKSRTAVLLGGILIASVAAGCYGGGRGWSNDPYGYNNGGYTSSYGSNGGYYNSNPYGGAYYNSYPSGYNGSYGNSYSYNPGYNGGSSYNAGYQNGVRADASRDRRQDRVAEQHTTVTREQESTERQPSRVVRDDHSSSESRSTHRSDIN